METGSTTSIEQLTPTPETEQYVRAALEAVGCRYTGQRGSVYSWLAQVDTHPTVDAIYQAVQQRWPNISLATVYNALDALVAAGLVNKLTHANSAARYDCRGEDHYHLRDVRTGKVEDLPAEYDAALLDKLDPELRHRLAAKGFRVTGYRLEVLGEYEGGNGASEAISDKAS